MSNLKLQFSHPSSSSSSSSSMASQSQAQGKLTVSTTSPKSDSGSGIGGGVPKGQCLCSPTTHEGSFRCRFHRSSSSTTPAWMKRSKSMPANKAAVSVSPPST